MKRLEKCSGDMRSTVEPTYQLTDVIRLIVPLNVFLPESANCRSNGTIRLGGLKKMLMEFSNGNNYLCTP